MNDYTKLGLRYRFFCWWGRWFYRLRMKLENWQDWIDKRASQYDPDNS